MTISKWMWVALAMICALVGISQNYTLGSKESIEAFGIVTVIIIVFGLGYWMMKKDDKGDETP